MKQINFLSKSGSQSMGHRVTTLALTVGSPSAHRRATMPKLISVLVLILTLGVGNVWGTVITTTHTFTSQTWTASGWTSVEAGSGFTNGQGVQFTGGNSGSVQSDTSYTTVSKIVVRYCTNASKGAGTIGVTVGSGTKKTFNVTKPSSGGTTLKNAEFTFSPNESGQIVLEASASANSVYIYSIAVTYDKVTATPKTVSFETGSGNSTLSSRTEASGGGGITLPSTSDLTPSCSGDGWVLYGWTTATYGSSSTTTAPSSTLVGKAGDKYYPTTNTTLYAVYRKADGEPENKSVTYTLNGNWTSTNGNWTKIAGSNLSSSLASGKYGLNSGSSTATSPIEYSDITEIKFTGSKSGSGSGTIEFFYGYGSSWTSLGSKAVANTQTWSISPSVSGNLKAVFSQSAGNVYIASIKVTYIDATYIYWSSPTCCSPLGSINGSVSLTNEGCAAGELKATWKTSSTGLDGIASQTVKVYRADNNNEVTGLTGLTGKTAQTTNQTVTISGLTPCVEYYVKIWNVSKDGSYCESDFAGDKSSNVAAASYTITKTGVTNVTAESLSAIPATTCASGFNATIVAASGYDLPGTITVTGANHTWNQATGALTISNVTGNVVITITPTEAQCTPLTAPSVSVSGKDYPYDAVTLSWMAVEHADGYTVEIYDGETKIEGDDLDGGADSYTIGTTLAANKTYTYKVKATSETPATYCPSEWATDDFTTADYPSATLTLSEVGGEDYNLSGTHKLFDVVKLPSTLTYAGCTGKVLVGWSSVAIETPGSLPEENYWVAGADYTLSSTSGTLYAVYATETPGSTSWDETALSSLGAGDVFVIVGNNGSNYAMTNNNGTSNPPAASSVTVSSTHLTGTIADNIKWNISGNATDGYVFYPNGSTTTWLYCTNANNGVRVGTGDAKHFTLNSGYLYETETSDNRFVGIYTSSDWRCYTSSGGNIANQTFKYYKLNVTAAVYSNYTTACAAALANPTFSPTEDAAEEYLAAQDLTINGPKDATIYYTMTTDGNEPADPTSSSDTYSAAISMNTRATYWIKAFAKKDASESEIVEAKYNINLPFTVAEAIAEIPNEGDERAKTYIDGIVCTAGEEIDEGTMIYYISDDGTETNRICIWYGKGLDNADFTGVTDLKVGDKVRVYGLLNNFNGTTHGHYYVDDSYLTSLLSASVSSITIGGTASKTAYSSEDNTFSFAGLTATATYNTGYVKDVTSEATWKANDVTSYTVTKTEDVSVTATLSDVTSEPKVVAVTYTTKTVASIRLEYASTYTFKGFELPKPRVYASYVEDIPEEEVTEFLTDANYDTKSVYDKDVADNYTITVEYKSKETTYSVTVKAIYNTQETAHSVADAIEIIKKSTYTSTSANPTAMYVHGVVSEVGSINNGKLGYYINDTESTDGQLQVYQGLYFGRESFTNDNILAVGDEVIIEGHMLYFSSTTPELKLSPLVYLLKKALPTISVENVDELEVGQADLDITELITKQGNGVVSLESGDLEKLTVDGLTLHAVEAGDVTVTANLAATDNTGSINYKANSTTFNVHVIAARTRYTVTFDANGADGGSAPEAIANQLEGAPVTLPECSYSWAKHGFTGWKVINLSTSAEIEIENNQFTMPAANVTIQAQWEEIATTHIVFNVNGNTETVAAVDVPQEVEYSITQVTDGQNGYEFVGWAENPETEDVEEAIATIESYTPEAGEASKTLYAVFKREYVGADKEDELTASDLTATGTSYADFSNVQKVSSAKYAGNSALNNSTNIQLRSDKSTAGIVSTVSGGTIKSVKITVANSNSNTIDVYGSNTAYSAASDLYGSSKGTKIGYTSSTATITPTAQQVFKYVGIRSNNGAAYLSKVTITWTPKTTYYTTAPAAVCDVTYELGTDPAGAWKQGEGCENAKVKVGQIFSICEDEPVRDHNKFNGWAVERNDTHAAVSVANNQFTMPAAAVTVSAVWVAKVESNVTYNAGTGTGDDVVVSNVEEGTEVTLKAIGSGEGQANFTKEDYDFKGWKYNGKTYKAGATIEMPAEAITLTAQWKKQNITKMTLVTDVAQLVDGSKVVIVSKDPVSNSQTKSSAIAGPMSGTNKFFASVTDDLIFNNDNTISYNAETAIELTLDKVEGGWALRSGDNYLAHGSSNQVKWQSDIAVWNISFSGNNATIKFSDNYSIQYNASSGSERFSAYSGSQNAVQLYASLTAITENASISEIGYVEGDVIVVSSGATLTMDAPSAPASITVKENAVVNVSAATEAGTVIVEKGAKLAIEEGGSVTTDEPLVLYTTLGKGTGTNTSGNAPGSSSEIINAERLNATGDVYLELELTQDAKASAGWYAFSVPFPVDAMNGVYYGNTKLTNEVGYAIMSHYGELRAKDEYAWKKFRGIMQPGVFYVITVGNTDYKTLRFKKVKDEALVASTSVAVSPFPSQTGNNADGAWNGIGNPNLAISNLSTAVTLMQFYDHKTNTFIGRNHSVNLVVGSAFFIQYSAGSTVSIPVGTTSNSGYLAPQREQNEAENTIYEVELTNVATGELEDNVFLTAREDAMNEYEIGRDVAKMSMGTAKCAQMWVPAYGTQLCAADFPLVNDKATYPLTINAPSAGTYTISTTATENATLYLTKNGRIYWNLTMGACELDLNQGQNNEYGLVLRAEVPAVTTGIENGELLNGENGVQKVVIDEHVYILRGGEMYDMTGKMVK